MKNTKIILLFSCLFLLIFNSQFHPGSRIQHPTISYHSQAFGTINNPGRRPPVWAQSAIGNQQSAFCIPKSGQTPARLGAIVTPGDWNRIEFSPTSTNSRMSWCKIEYANFGVNINVSISSFNI